MKGSAQFCHFFQDHVDQMCEEVSCNFCRSEEKKVLFSKCRDRLYKCEGDFSIVQCKECNLIYLAPRPKMTIVDQFYPPQYSSHQTRVAKAGLGGKLGQSLKRGMRYLATAPYRIRFGDDAGTFPPFGSARVLDIGCGTGEFLAAMQRLEWEAHGCDISKQTINYARKNYKIDQLHCGRLEELPYPDNFFDAITMWHTLEHLHDPLGSLKKAHRLLKNQGKLVVAVPNINSWEAKFFKDRWMLDVPRHLYFFSPGTLSLMLKRAGFQVGKIRPQLHPSSIADSIDLVLDDVFKRNGHSQRKLIYYALFSPATLSYLMGNWGCIEVTCAKVRPG